MPYIPKDMHSVNTQEHLIPFFDSYMKKALAAVYVLPMYSCILKFKSLAISRKVRDFTQNPLKKQTVANPVSIHVPNCCFLLMTVLRLL